MSVCPSRLTAFVDEAETPQEVDPGTYVLAAAILAADTFEAARSHMRPLRKVGQKKAHWHEARSDREKSALIDGVLEIDVEVIVAVRLGDVATRIERRRRLCFERLIFELEQRGVREIVVESRGPGDRHDLAHLQALRSQRRVSSKLRLHHVPGPAEPLLWIPDVVCGAVTRDRVGDSRHLQRLSDMVSMIHL